MCVKDEVSDETVKGGYWGLSDFMFHFSYEGNHRIRIYSKDLYKTLILLLR